MVHKGAHLGTKFGYTVDYDKHLRVMRNYLQKITPICCHAHRVNRAWPEAESWFRVRLTIEPQSNLLCFERNQAEDHEDTATVCSNYTIKKCHSSQSNHSPCTAFSFSNKLMLIIPLQYSLWL